MGEHFIINVRAVQELYSLAAELMNCGNDVINEEGEEFFPGSPAWLAKASNYTRTSSKYGLMDVQLTGHNAIQGLFKFEG